MLTFTKLLILKNNINIFIFLLLAVVIGYLVYTDFINPKPIEKTEIILSYGVPELVIPDTVMFAGERVPLEIPDVHERLDRELHVNTFWHSNTIFLLKRGHRWLPDIKMEFEKVGVPSDLMYLSVIESDLQNKISPSNAVGFWQLLKGTAKDFRLEVTNEVDERYHPMKSTDAAAIYLRKAYQKFGSWTNAAASYNIGRRGLDRALTKQAVTSYYDLLLGEETSRYVFRAIAIKLIFEHPEKYGFNFSEAHLYQKEDLEEIEITETIKNLRDWAFENNINYKQLKRYNPWLRRNSLTVRRGKSYIFQIPKYDKTPVIIADTTSILVEEDTLNPDVRELPTEPEDGL
ncbi:MAG: lytic transglycosylase domain-containing protein [Cyclobacteriaceae bacterium]|nr:lytic transglycosylase domain-containing protein [Cyclobacteriaceae bacterium]